MLSYTFHCQQYKTYLGIYVFVCAFICFWRDSPQWARASSFTSFLDHTQRRTTVGRTLLDEWSARRRDLYLTTHKNHNRPTSMPPVGFEPTISEGERPQTYPLDRAATGTGRYSCIVRYLCLILTKHEFSWQILIKVSNTKFSESLYRGSQVVACRLTDWQTAMKLLGAFRSFANAPKNVCKLAIIVAVLVVVPLYCCTPDRFPVTLVLFDDADATIWTWPAINDRSFCEPNSSSANFRWYSSLEVLYEIEMLLKSYRVFIAVKVELRISVLLMRFVRVDVLKEF